MFIAYYYFKLFPAARAILLFCQMWTHQKEREQNFVAWPHSAFFSFDFENSASTTKLNITYWARGEQCKQGSK